MARSIKVSVYKDGLAVRPALYSEAKIVESVDLSWPIDRIRNLKTCISSSNIQKMDTLNVASKAAAKRYIEAAHTFGLTVDAIIEDLNNHGHENVTQEDIGAILKDIRQIPRSTYLWHNLIFKATNGQNPMGCYPWNSWSSRFILSCKANNETDSTIFAKMRKRGYEIPEEHWVEVVLKEHMFIENGLADRSDTHDGAALQNVIVMAHNWGYTLREITSRIPKSTLRLHRSTSNSKTNMAKLALEDNGIPEAQHRRGRKFSVVAEKFVLSAYNLGMDVNNIRDRMYMHGFDNFDPEAIKFLKSKELWRDEQASQDTQPMQPRASDYVIPRDGNVARRMNPANQEPGRRMTVMDLLN